MGVGSQGSLSVPWVERRINALALHHYLTLQYTPDPLTIFEGIQQLPAGHKLVVEREGLPKVSRWWHCILSPNGILKRKKLSSKPVRS